MNTCCANTKIPGLTFYRDRPCKAVAKVERDGKHYCLRHDPVARQTKLDANSAKWQAAWDAKKKQADHRVRCVLACAGLRPEVIDRLPHSLLFIRTVVDEPTAPEVRLQKIREELERLWK